MRDSASLLAIALASASALSLHGRQRTSPGAPRLAARLDTAECTRSDALDGGRPSSALQIEGAAFAHLIQGVVKNAELDTNKDPTHVPTPWARAWLELANGENLIVSFERTRDDTNETCTMRVRQSRLTAECSLDNPAACKDMGCVAVRWNLQRREGVLVDLFKAKKGMRTNCDLSSADNPRVKWGQHMLRVVDDIAALLGVRHMYLADESSVQLQVWDEKTQGGQSVTVMQKYLRPLLHGMSYYDAFGYYTIPPDEYYNGKKSTGLMMTRPDEDESVRVRPAQGDAAAEMRAFHALRTAPFQDGHFASALASVEHTDVAPPRDVTLIYRFALAVAAAQEAPPAERVAAFRAAAARTSDEQHSGGSGGDGGIRHQFWIHSRSVIPSDSTFEEFVTRHEASIDVELLSASHISEMVRILHARNRAAASDGAGDDDDRKGLKAGALLLALMFDLWAVYSPKRFTPLKRKDYYEHGSLASAPSVHGDDAPTTIGVAPREPFISASFYVCDSEEEIEGMCELPVY